MSVNFVSTSNEYLASHRYRIQSPQTGLLMEGIECKVSPHFLLDADVCIYSKHLNLADYPDAIGARGMGKRVIFDICDDHTETEMADHYNRMVSVAHEITCNSEQMARRIREVWKKKATVIPDPIIYNPIDRVPDLTKFLWFGFHGNISALIDNIDLVGDRQLEICTGPIKGAVSPYVTLTRFSPEEQQRAFHRNGVAYLPYGTDRTATKSANRIIEALNASMVVVTNGIPASRELDSFVEVSLEDVSEKSIQKMEAGRAFVRKKYSQKAITKLWRKVLGV